MARSQNIDAILRSWPYQPGEVGARLIRGSDGRQILQMRVDLGVLQLEVDHRPDGGRPGGAETYFDFLLGQVVHDGSSLTLDDEQCAEVDREFVQFYQRRLCWLALREFNRAVRDADHSLALMDFVRGCSPSELWTRSHEQYRPFILFHRTQAAALAALEEHGPEAAIEEINQGLERLKLAIVELDPEESTDDDEMVRRLGELRQSLRDHYHVGKTLQERLAEAVAAEQYELAAQLRDELARRHLPDAPM